MITDETRIGCFSRFKNTPEYGVLPKVYQHATHRLPGDLFQLPLSGIALPSRSVDRSTREWVQS